MELGFCIIHFQFVTINSQTRQEFQIQLEQKEEDSKTKENELNSQIKQLQDEVYTLLLQANY